MNRLFALFLFVSLAAAGAELPTASEKPWELRLAKQRKQTLAAPDYSAAIGKVLEVRLEPGHFSYCELNLREPVEIAAADWKGEFTLDVFAEPAEALRFVSIRVQDATGETFQYRVSAKLRPGVWAKLTIPAAKPASVWGGNKDKKLDYPIRFQAVTADFDNSAPGEVRFLLDKLAWVTK